MNVKNAAFNFFPLLFFGFLCLSDLHVNSIHRNVNSFILPARLCKGSNLSTGGKQNSSSVKNDKYELYLIRKEEKKHLSTSGHILQVRMCTSATVYMQTAFIYVS